jgi:hypothetical protein
MGRRGMDVTLMGKLYGKRPLGRTRHKRVDNKTDLREVRWGGKVKKVKLSLQQALEAYRVLRC